jgi:hypothetical protein
MSVAVDQHDGTPIICWCQSRCVETKPLAD